MTDLVHAAGSSLVDQLRAARAAAAARTTVRIAVAGYDNPQLIAEYRLLSSDEVKLIGERVRRQFKTDVDRILHASLDLLTSACEAFYIFRPEDDEPVLLDPDGEGPIGYDVRLCEMLGFEATSAREIVRGVFVDNDFAVVGHAQKLQRWMNDTSVDLDADLVGEA